MTTYPVHTPIADIANFDRSIKVEFECMNHPDSKWASKNPFVSNWFPTAENSSPTGYTLHECMCPASKHWTSKEYTA